MEEETDGCEADFVWVRVPFLFPLIGSQLEGFTSSFQTELKERPESLSVRAGPLPLPPTAMLQSWATSATPGRLAKPADLWLCRGKHLNIIYLHSLFSSLHTLCKTHCTLYLLSEARVKRISVCVCVWLFWSIFCARYLPLSFWNLFSCMAF